jgi:hypothetical protein
MTTTNQCANDYMVTQSSTGSTSNQQSQASIAAGNAAWEAQQKAQGSNSDWSATKASTRQAGNAVGTVGASEPALTQAQQQQFLGLAQQ